MVDNFTLRPVSSGAGDFSELMGRLFTGLIGERRAKRKPTARLLCAGKYTAHVDGVQTAFKEWGVVVEALGCGEQIIILRKGGIAEGRGGFRAEHERFWLFPTRFHQQAEGVIESTRAGFANYAWPPEDVLRIEFCAEVAEARRLDSLAQAQRLAGQHIWREEVIVERFDWGRDTGIYAMAVRVRRLAAPVEMPMRESYGGCKSWVELEGAPNVANTEPVLDEASFATKLNAFAEALS